MPAAGRISTPTSSEDARARSFWGNMSEAERELRREYARREAARQRLIPFGQYIWPGFEARPHRELIAAALEMVEAGDITRLMIFMPSQMGKSTLVSQVFPPWYLGRNPDKNVIMCCYNAELAQQLSYLARDNIISEGYKAIFGDLSPYELPVELSEKASATKHWRLKPPYRGGLKAAGIGTGIGGFPGNLILIDDPLKDPDDADSEKIRNSQVNWYKQAAYNRLSHGTDGEGAVVLVQTRWHDMELSGQLLKEQAEDGELWHVLRLPVIGETEREIEEWCKRNNVDKAHYLVAAPRKDDA